MIDKVLIVDDDEITLMICEMVIQKEKFAREIIKLKDGQEGIDYFQKLCSSESTSSGEKAPELVLLDLNMPVMSGWEFLEEFSEKFEERFPDVKICILTSSVDPLDLTNSKIFNNVIGFINKPLTADRIREIKENEALAHYFTTR